MRVLPISTLNEGARSPAKRASRHECSAVLSRRPVDAHASRTTDFRPSASLMNSSCFSSGSILLLLCFLFFSTGGEFVPVGVERQTGCVMAWFDGKVSSFDCKQDSAGYDGRSSVSGLFCRRDVVDGKG